LNLDIIKRRLQRLEPISEKLEPWPPDKEIDSVAWCFWQEIGRPIERMTFEEMMDTVAKRGWQSKVIE